MLGIIVSMYKLIDDTELTINMGLVSFVLWLIASTISAISLDHHTVWETLERQFNEKSNEINNADG
jgi:paraquat-inducible protein A